MNKPEGFYRPNVVMAVMKNGRLLLLERVKNRDNWQVPQGGVDEGEGAEEAMWRELKEETGLLPGMAEIHAVTKSDLRYDIPPRYRRRGDNFKGQKQRWFLLELHAGDENIHFANMRQPEFSSWRWCGYWSAIYYAVDFKREVYRDALLELLPQALKLGV